MTLPEHTHCDTNDKQMKMDSGSDWPDLHFGQTLLL